MGHQFSIKNWGLRFSESSNTFYNYLCRMATKIIKQWVWLLAELKRMLDRPAYPFECLIYSLIMGHNKIWLLLIPSNMIK